MIRKAFVILSLAFATSILSALKASADQYGDFNYTSDGTNAVITEYSGDGGDVTIPATINDIPVTTIQKFAFARCNSLKRITILGRVTIIGVGAFTSCSNLISVTLPNSVTTIQNAAFRGCTSLSSITIPGRVTTIVSSAFNACTALTDITVAPTNTLYSSLDGVLFNKAQTIIKKYPGGKSGDYMIPNTVTSIGDWAFFECESMSSITIPNSVTNIGSYAFARCKSLTSVKGGSSVTTIGSFAFKECDSLASITIPNSVTSIGYGAFCSCTSPTNVTLHAKVADIGFAAFAGCTALNNIAIAPSNPSYSSLDGVLFNKAQTTLIQCSAGKSGSFTIPAGVTTIGFYAFYRCTSLTTVTIPDCVTTIGLSAFEYCSSLTSSTIPASVTSIEYAAFRHCPSLVRVNFCGKPPTHDSDVFSNTPATLYYLPAHAEHWPKTYAGRPTAVWQQQVP